MNRFLVHKEVELDYGHRIQLHNSKCKNLHGHRGKVVAHISGPLQEEGSATGMVLDFGDIKEMLMSLHNQWDHALLLEQTDPLYVKCFSQEMDFLEDNGLGKLVVLGFAPTAENLAWYAFKYFEGWLSARYDASIRVEKVEFFETPTSCATIDRNYIDMYVVE